jgi:pimeloyl-ACP methyl ester carboxylesterase
VKPLWFGPEDRSLFGWLHGPESRLARGGVVLSPTIGLEAVSAHYGYRRLADRLADAGFVALRFDYPGTGDSAGGSNDEGLVAAWLGSIRTAVDLLEAMGLGRVSVIGMRMGATLVAETFGWGPARIDDVVLWDPCASGRAFLRDQSALSSFALGSRTNHDGSIETPGVVYDPGTVADLSAVAIANADGPLAEGVLLLTRSSRKVEGRMHERLALAHVHRETIRGQEQFVDVEPELARPPEATIETIVGWLSVRAAASPLVSVDINAVGRTRAMVGTAVDGVSVEEGLVSLGPHGLFGIVSARADPKEPSPHLPVILFLNAGSSSHVGPARLWVQLGREWAGSGFRVIRFDLGGIGDSPVRNGAPGPEVWAAEALDDLVDVLRDVAPGDPSNAVLVGLCSGAYHAVEGAIATQVRGVCVVNPMLVFLPPEDGKLDGRRQASAAPKRWARSLPGHYLVGRLGDRLPSVVWRMINRLAVEATPARSLSKVLDGGVEDVFVIAGDYEARLLTRGEDRTLRRLRETGRFRMEIIPDLEHSLFERHGRELATRLLTEHVLVSYK